MGYKGYEDGFRVFDDGSKLQEHFEFNANRNSPVLSEYDLQRAPISQWPDIVGAKASPAERMSPDTFTSSLQTMITSQTSLAGTNTLSTIEALRAGGSGTPFAQMTEAQLAQYDVTNGHPELMPAFMDCMKQAQANPNFGAADVQKVFDQVHTRYQDAIKGLDAEIRDPAADDTPTQEANLGQRSPAVFRV